MKNGKIETKQGRNAFVLVGVALVAIVAIVFLSKSGGQILTGNVILQTSIGNTEFVDADGDGTNDLKVVVSRGTSTSTAQITVTKLRGAKPAAVTAEAPAAAPAEEETPAVPEETAPVTAEPTLVTPTSEAGTSTALVAIVVLALVLVIGVGYFMFFRKKA